MRIEKVEIKAFRNIENLCFEVKENVVAFCGNNKLGKTNCLNAIYWCLTGVVLDNSTGDEKNIPYGQEYASVVVYTEKGKFSRSVDKAHTQTLLFNDIEVRKSEFEEKVYGKTNNLFNEFRFFLNPMYLNSVKESDFRKWYLKRLSVDIEGEFIKLNDLEKEYLLELPTRNFNIEEVSKLYSTFKSTKKKEVEKWTIICDYLHKYKPTETKDIEQAELYLSLEQKDLSQIETKIITLDKFALEIDKLYQEKTSVRLLEKGIGEEVWKEVCRPVVKGTDTYWFNGSTAEQKTTLIEFICSCGSNLPIFIDEAEIYDSNSAKELVGCLDNQLFVAKVEDGIEQLKIRGI